jgi:tyrosyl-tRNA synthetase
VTTSFLDELRWRGLLHQTTATDELEKHLATGSRVGYAGFDPTADSLTIGHLLPIRLLMLWQRAGHRPIVVMGGGTGMIGDPSGKDAERTLQSAERIEANIAGQRRVFDRLIDMGGPRGAMLVNNHDWLSKLGYLEMLRDVGKHFSVNAMIQKDSVRERLNNREQGISYTEFSYMLLQAYDFFHLKQHHGCTVQMAGSDQYGNIVAGIDLIRRKLHDTGDTTAYGITNPLVTRSDGKKIGKTEKGAIFLTADRTSPYAFYQFWINAEDSDVENYLKWFTFLDQPTIEGLIASHRAAPEKREAQRVLAKHMTELVHGGDALSSVEMATQALFSGEVKALSHEMLGQVFADVPHSEHAKSTLEGEGVALGDLLAQTTLASSKREARQFLSSGAVAVNGEKVGEEHKLTTRDLLHGDTILLRRGKKSWHATVWK